MRLDRTYDGHHNAGYEWESRDLKDWITDIFEAPRIAIEPGCTGDIREHVTTEFMNEGWAIDVKVDNNANLKILSIKHDLAFQLQTGNWSRVPYDLLKLQYLFQSKRIEAAALAVPSARAAKSMGSNLANSERLVRELLLFDRVITVPILVIGFQ